LVFLSIVLAVFGAQFTANVNITTPGVNGIMIGKLYYSDTGYLRVDYTIGVTIITDYNQGISRKQCPGFSCEATVTNSPLLKFVADGTFSAAGSTYTTTSTATTLQISKITTNSAGLTQTATASDGTLYSFTNQQSTVDLSVFNAYTSWNCPTTQCNQPVDAVLVFDNSGSIGTDQWSNIVSFSQQFANNFVFGPTQTRMGLVWFGNDAELKTPGTGMINDKTSFVNAVNLPRPTQAQSSCIGCGLRVALQLLANTKRAGIPQIMLVLTDGQNNVPNVQRGCFQWDGSNCYGSGGRSDGSGDQWLDYVPKMQALYPDLTVYGVGVGTGQIVTDFMTQLSSPNSYIPIGNYQQLQASVDKITSKTCPATNEISCNCAGGFCGCGGGCLCPSACTSTNCNKGSCPKPALGCISTAVTCIHDACHTAQCIESQGGCVQAAVTCPAATGCYASFCDPVNGCSKANNVTSCPTASSDPTCTQCITGVCNHNTSCTCANANCNSCQTCDPSNGQCLPKDCNDQNVCTQDSCADGVCSHTNIPCTPNACQTATCDPVNGCKYTQRNATTYCDDLNPCTLDTCDNTLGCLHNNLTCTLPNATACTNLTCDPVQGCPTELIDYDCAKYGNLSLYIGTCHVAACNESTGCYLATVEGQAVDRCGYCANLNICVLIPALTGGAIAGIAVGGAAAAAIAAFAGKKGYDYFAANQAAAGAVQNNPMYTSNTANADNPMYTPGAV